MNETANLNTKAKILEGVRSHLTKSGGQNFSARSVAKEAGVNHGLIHHYFGSKENLILAFIDYYGQQIESAVEKRTQELKCKSELAVVLKEIMLDQSVPPVVTELLSMGRDSALIQERLKKLIHQRIELMEQLLESDDRRDAVMIVGLVIGLVVLSRVDADLEGEQAIKRLIEKIEGDK